MTKVVVAGGGVAGIAAAVRARALDAGVTLIDASETTVSKSLLPYLITGEVARDDLRLVEPNELRALGIETRIHETVTSVNTERRVLETDRSRVQYDSLVIATGSSGVPDTVGGFSKRGVYSLQNADEYIALKEGIEKISVAAVQGSSPLALVVAEMLAKKGLRVSLFSGSLLRGYFSGAIRELVLKEIQEKGVKVIQGGVERTAGLERVEAVVSGGSVYPCEALVIFPRSVPSLPAIDARRGKSGGILVDKSMKTSVPRVFAAGDCAELSIGSSSLQIRLQSASRVMGEAAGANAAGASENARVSGAVSLDIFGLELCSAGMTIEEAIDAGIDAQEVSSVVDPRAETLRKGSVVCTLVFDKVSRVVYGLQFAGWRGLSYSYLASLAVSMNVRLSDLAYLESTYHPRLSGLESPVSITAKKALSMVDS